MKKFIFNFVLKLFGLSKSSTSIDKKGIVIILIDGASFFTLQKALKRDYCPFIHSLIKQKDFELHPYFCGLPSATTATEAQLFFGNNFNIPGYSWYDRTLRQFIRGTFGDQIKRFEESIEAKWKLLDNGSCIAGVYSAGATMCSLSGEDLTKKNVMHSLSKLYFLILFLLNPVRFALFIWILTKSVFFGIIHLIKNDFQKYRPILSEEFSRLTFGSIAHYLAQLEIFRETPVLFVDFVLYDEIAHIHGVNKVISMNSLRLIDSYCKSLYNASNQANRKYEFIILSDHGQSSAIPFEDYFHESIAKFISRALNSKTKIVVKTFGRHIPPLHRDDSPLYIIPSGSCSQIYFQERFSSPYTEDELIQLFPQFLPTLIHHEGVGWILIRTSASTQKLIAKKGYAVFKDSKLIERHGEIFSSDEESDKLYSSFARYASFPNNGDIVLFGNIIHDKIISFEQHKGTHGGFWKEMIYPFLLSSNQTLITQIKKDDDMNKLFDKIHSITNA